MAEPGLQRIVTDGPNFWQSSLQQWFSQLGSCPTGLTAAQASKAEKQFGSNELPKDISLGPGRMLLKIFGNPMVLLLLAASGVSALVGEMTNASLIVVIVVVSCLVEFMQAYRSGQAAAKLLESVATKAKVLRDGQEAEIPLSKIVPGDVVLLEAGSLVPGDGLLLFAKELTTHEAALTGESLPAEKHAVNPESDGVDHIADQGLDSKPPSAVFLGTSVVSGMGRVLVIRTGANTELGKVATHLSQGKGETEFERGTRRFGF